MSSQSTAGHPRFRRYLRRLKRDGCNLLLVGRLPERARERVARRFFGASTERRYRVLLTTRAADPDLRLPADLDAAARERLRVLDRPVATRGAAAVAPDAGYRGDSADAGYRGDAAGDPATVRAEVLDAIAALEAVDDGVGPGELRVGVDSLAPLLCTHGTAGVREFVAPVAERVRELNGMGHYYLPVERDSRAERDLRTAFDAVIEQRAADDRVLQRWHAADGAFSTGWIDV